MTGTIINAAAIFAGGLLGWWAGSLLSEQMRGTLLAVMGLVVTVMGIEMALEWGNSPLPIIIAVVVGGAAGELLDIEGRLEALGQRLQRLMRSRFQGDLATGFVQTTMIYCVGPMAVLGALESGLQGSHRILLSKAAIDGITAIAFASTLGLGVIFSGVSVFVYQGLLTLGARYVATAMAFAGSRLTATGGILIMGLGLKILGIKEIRVANLLPALPAVVLIAWIC